MISSRGTILGVHHGSHGLRNMMVHTALPAIGGDEWNEKP
jgi:hypothetical protein